MINRYDIVRLKTGSSPLKLLEKKFFSYEEVFGKRISRETRIRMKGQKRTGLHYRVAYLSSIAQRDDRSFWRHADDFELYQEPPTYEIIGGEALSRNYAEEVALSKYGQSVEPYVHENYKEENMTKQLYQTKEEKPRFGTFLTTNSAGKIVLEMKGKDGDVEAFDKDALEKVLPHTVKLATFCSVHKERREIIYQIAQGAVEVGDVLIQLTTTTLWEVVEVDCKVESGRQSTNGFLKISGTRVVTDK